MQHEVAKEALMTIRVPSPKLVAGIGLLLIFPFFFLYDSAIALNAIPPFAGSYYGLVTIILAPILVALQIRAFWLRTSRITITDLVFFALSSYMLYWGLIHFFFAYGYQTRPDLLTQTLDIVISWVVLFVIFRNVDLHNRKLFLLMLISGIIMVVITLAYQRNGYFYARGLATSGAELVSSYQWFARIAFIVSLFLLCTVRSRWMILIWAASLAELYLLGARTEFFAFLPIGLLILLLRAGVTRFIVIMLPFLLIISLVFLNLAGAQTNARIDNLLNNTNLDGSYQSRNTFTQFALDTIRSNPFTGDYGSQVLVSYACLTGCTGKYAHNALSAWVSFGLIGFLAFVFLLLRGFILSTIQIISNHRRDALSIFIFALTAYLLLASVTAKSVYEILFGAGFGLIARLEEQKSLSGTDAKLTDAN